MIDQSYLEKVLAEAKALHLHGYEFYGVREALRNETPEVLAKRLREVAEQVLAGVAAQASEERASACGGCAWSLYRLARMVTEP